jgi:hypothetical protein
MRFNPLTGASGATDALLHSVGSRGIGLSLFLAVMVAMVGDLAGCAIKATTARPAPALSADPRTVNFGTVKIGSQESYSIQITNPGQVSVTITAATISGDAFGASGLVLPATIKAGSNSRLRVVFAPHSAGTADGMVALTTSAGTSHGIVLTGTGVVADAFPQWTIHPKDLNFGNVQLGNTESQNATLTNTGTCDITVSVITIAGLGYNVSGVVQGQRLTSGQSAPLTVTFTPTASGSAEGSASIANSASTPPAVIYLSGGSHLVNLSWNPSPTSNVIGYNIYRASLVTNAGATRLNSNLVSGTTFTDTSVIAGQTYSYMVTAVDSNGAESSFSDPAPATIPTP